MTVREATVEVTTVVTTLADVPSVIVVITVSVTTAAPVVARSTAVVAVEVPFAVKVLLTTVEEFELVSTSVVLNTMAPGNGSSGVITRRLDVDVETFACAIAPWEALELSTRYTYWRKEEPSTYRLLSVKENGDRHISAVSEDAAPTNAEIGIEIVKPFPRTKSTSMLEAFAAQGISSVEFPSTSPLKSVIMLLFQDCGRMMPNVVVSNTISTCGKVRADPLAVDEISSIYTEYPVVGFTKSKRYKAPLYRAESIAPKRISPLRESGFIQRENPGVWI